MNDTKLFSKEICGIAYKFTPLMKNHGYPSSYSTHHHKPPGCKPDKWPCNCQMMDLTAVK
jgi:hypothetical protein